MNPRWQIDLYPSKDKRIQSPWEYGNGCSPDGTGPGLTRLYPLWPVLPDYAGDELVKSEIEIVQHSIMGGREVPRRLQSAVFWSRWFTSPLNAVISHKSRNYQPAIVQGCSRGANLQDASLARRRNAEDVLHERGLGTLGFYGISSGLS